MTRRRYTSLMRPLIVLCLAISVSAGFAQVPTLKDQGYNLALPSSSGRIRMTAPSFQIVEASAKASGSEIGLRGEDSSASIGLLIFLFRYPEEAPLTSQKCRDSIIRHLKEDNPRATLKSETVLPGQPEPVALAEYASNTPTAQWSMVRAFVATRDICADIEFSSKHPISPETPEIKAALASLSFEPDAKAGFPDVFKYAFVLSNHDMWKAAAPFYEQSLSLLPANEPTNTWRRVATDQTAMAYGISGDLQKSRALIDRAIKADPDYPLNYYNLACVDAEEGNAKAAKLHLQQAFDRRAHTLPGESFPDPTKDDSFLKLKTDREFWAFAQSLQANR